MMAIHSTISPKVLIFSLVFCSITLRTTAEEKRWSRQISNAGFLNDWIPVQPQAQPQPRQTNGRVLNFGPPFAQNEFNQQQPSVGSTTTNLGEPFQRIFLQQMHPPNLPILPQNQQQLHVSNFQSTPFRLHNEMQLNAGPLNTGPQHFLLQHPQPELPTPQFRYPQFNPQTKPDFVRNGDSSLQPPQTQQLIQSEPPQLKTNGLENQQPSLEMQVPPQEEVQLLYVPLDTLYHQQQEKLQQNTRYNILPSPVNPLAINNFYTHHQKFPATTVTPTGTPFKITTPPAAKLRTTTSKPVHRFSFNTVTESPKPKSHQPPLAMFMRNSLSVANSPSVNDVLSHLVFSRSIDVIDAVGGNAPNIFIGPYGLNTPDGYSKFELPYLSALEQTRSDRQINMLPFFVAPLSYRAPKGFAKIPLPTPHVGSVVVNTPNSIPDVNSYDNKNFFSDAKLHQPTTKKPAQYFSYSTPAPERSRTTSRFRFGSEVSKPTYQQNEPEVVSPTPTTPSSLNNFSTFKSTPAYKAQIDNLFQHSIASESDEQNFNSFGSKYHTTSNFATAAPPKQASQPVVDYHRLKDEGPSKYPFTNTQPVNTTAFTFQKEEPQSVFGSFFTQTPTASFFNTPEPVVPVVTTRQPEVTKFDVTNFDEPQRYSPFVSSTPPPTSTSTTSTPSGHDDEDTYRNDEIEKMKSYFREQEAFKVRNPIAISTPAAYYESSSTGTLATEKGYNEFSTIPTRSNYFTKEPKQHTQNVATTPRTTVTYYTASSSADTSSEQDVPRLKGHSVHKFRFVDSVVKDENQIPTTPKPEEKFIQHEPLQYNEVYSTSPRYETTRAPYRERQTIPPFEENTATYDIPSELSPIQSNLPGLVNSLMEKDGNTTPYVTVPTTSPVSITTRRSSISRTRTRPPTTPRTHQIDDGSAPEITTRRPVRGRRPINYANRTSTVRTTTPRNVSRVRFNPTTDERNNIRTSTRTRARVTGRPAGKEEENIDYQRDVLKQNYPVITKNINKSVDEQPNRAYSFSRETTIPPFEQVKIEKNVEVSYSEKESTVPERYFGSKDDGTRIQNQLLQKEPEIPQIISTTTYTSIQNEDNQEEITEVLKTRKPSFIRRVPTSTVRSVTTQRYTTQSQSQSQSEYDPNRAKERNSVRQKNWQETSSAAPRIAKPRVRGKRPLVIATTTVNPTTELNTDQSFQQINSFNKGFYKESLYNKKTTVNDTKSSPEKRKNQFRFSLNAEESQWSAKFNANSFQPLSPNEKSKSSNNLPEVEIVTASPMSDSEKETYSFNVQANFFDFNKNKENDSASTTTQPETNNVEPDTVYSNELGKISSNRNVGTEENSVQNSSPQFGENKSGKAGTSDQESGQKSEKKGRRRGVWKRVRVRPVDSFETAESQNIGKQLYNTIISDNVKEFGERNAKKPVGARIISSPSAYAYEETINYNDDIDQNENNEPDVQTVLPMQTTESTKDDFDLTTMSSESVESSEITTESIEKDERELEATSTVNYNDSDDLTTTIMPFISSGDDLESLEKSTERPKTNTASAHDKSIKSNVSDQISEPSSIMDEVKQKLTELFSFEDDDVVVSTTERVFKFNRNFKRPKSPLPHYTTVDRNPLVNDIANDEKDSESGVKSSPASMKLEPVPVLKTILRPITEPSSFHKELMDSVIYATSTSTEITESTEICYRGRCVKTHKKP
ncbi:mucin-17 [Sitodiplosis mosellana]|uniref:mucin-17 n=1 Tax=Sitodiplosis mosellana TaxID=263140 RepID=UPI002444B973|nr:mucin-17 [Sitodiplosis mosellana]